MCLSSLFALVCVCFACLPSCTLFVLCCVVPFAFRSGAEPHLEVLPSVPCFCILFCDACCCVGFLRADPMQSSQLHRGRGACVVRVARWQRVCMWERVVVVVPWFAWNCSLRLRITLQQPHDRWITFRTLDELLEAQLAVLVAVHLAKDFVRSLLGRTLVLGHLHHRADHFVDGLCTEKQKQGTGM